MLPQSDLRSLLGFDTEWVAVPPTFLDESYALHLVTNLESFIVLLQNWENYAACNHGNLTDRKLNQIKNCL